MVELMMMNRSRGFAEGVVVMICPVLLALALDKVDREVYGRVVPVLMLVIASVTLISGICPLLACCFLERFPGCAGVRSPAPVATSMASVSSACLLFLACWMAQLVVSRSIAISIGVVFGVCAVARIADYYRPHGENNAAADNDTDQLRGTHGYADQLCGTHGEINTVTTDDADQLCGTHGEINTAVDDANQLRGTHGEINTAADDTDQLHGTHSEINAAATDDVDQLHGIHGEINAASADDEDQLHGTHGEINAATTDDADQLRGTRGEINAASADDEDQLHGTHGEINEINAASADDEDQLHGTHGEINAAATDDADQLHGTRGEINTAAADDADQLCGTHGEINAAADNDVDQLRSTHGKINTAAADKADQLRGTHGEINAATDDNADQLRGTHGEINAPAADDADQLHGHSEIKAVAADDADQLHGTHGEIKVVADDDADRLHGTYGEINAVVVEINAAADDDADQLRGILDSSLEFLSGVTGILFLGLEGLALEGHNQVIKGHGRQFALGAPMGTVFFCCALGVFLMLLEMIPPLRFDTVKRIVNFTLAVDGIMVTGTLIVLVVVMAKLMGPVGALLLILPPVIILLEYVYRVLTTGGIAATAARREPKPASLELTRVTFTGFLAVSVTAISGGSPGWLTNGFLLFAAAAIVFGLSWRLLSQEQIRRKLEDCADRAYPDGLASSANLASFCTHLCIVIATVLFAVMAGIAGHGHGRGEQESAPAPTHVGGSDFYACAPPHTMSSAQVFAPAHVITGFTSVILPFF